MMNNETFTTKPLEERAKEQGATERWVTRDGFTLLPNAMRAELGIGDGALIWFQKDQGRWGAWTAAELDQMFVLLGHPPTDEDIKKQAKEQVWVTRDGYTQLPDQIRAELQGGDGAHVWFLKNHERWEAWTEEDLTEAFRPDDD